MNNVNKSQGPLEALITSLKGDGNSELDTKRQRGINLQYIQAHHSNLRIAETHHQPPTPGPQLQALTQISTEERGKFSNEKSHLGAAGGHENWVWEESFKQLSSMLQHPGNQT